MGHALVTPVHASPQISQMYSATRSEVSLGHCWGALLPRCSLNSAIQGRLWPSVALGFWHRGLRLGLRDWERPRSLNNDPRGTIRAHLLERQPARLPCRTFPSSTRQPALQLITGLGSRMGQMSTSRGPAWEQGLPGLAWGLPLSTP